MRYVQLSFVTNTPCLWWYPQKAISKTLVLIYLLTTNVYPMFTSKLTLFESMSAQIIYAEKYRSKRQISQFKRLKSASSCPDLVLKLACLFHYQRCENYQQNSTNFDIYIKRGHVCTIKNNNNFASISMLYKYINRLIQPRKVAKPSHYFDIKRIIVWAVCLHLN